MNAAVILIVGIVILALGYVFYGGWQIGRASCRERV